VDSGVKAEEQDEVTSERVTESAEDAMELRKASGDSAAVHAKEASQTVRLLDSLTSSPRP
jgi:hypothetical protein